jgi:hypothetical protein
MTARLTRLLASALLLAGGIIHYELWNSGYRNVPKVGPLFLANFGGSVVLAAAVLLSRRATVAVGGILFAAGSLTALVLSRTVGFFGFTETVWTTQAIRTLAAEVGAIGALGCALTMQHRQRQPLLHTIRTR